MVALLATLMLMMTLDKPPETNRVAEGAATVAASQEYDRVMELWGDPVSAQAASEQKYQEVLEQWGQ